jgi:hypothetical protein
MNVDPIEYCTKYKFRNTVKKCKKIIPTGWELDEAKIVHHHPHKHTSVTRDCKYKDTEVEITVLSRETFRIDDYDLFTKIQVFVDGRKVFEEDE